MKAKAITLKFEDIAGQYKLRIAAWTLITVCVLGLALNVAHGDSIPGWGNDIKSAFADAKASGKPLIMVIAQNGCPACEYFAVEAVKTPAANALSEFVRLRVEAPENPDLHRQYASEGTPTIVVFTADTSYETPVYSHTGALRAVDIVKLARAVQPQEVAETKTDSSKQNVAGSDKERTRSTESEQQLSASSRRRSTSLLASAKSPNTH